jgi:hypothetical protein
MKFMIINRPNGQNYSETSSKSLIDTKPLREMLNDGSLECAYSMVSGGHVYVVNADDAMELVYKVRGNPLIHPLIF